MNRLITAITGITGISAAEIAQQIPEPSEIESIGKLIIQIIIGIVSVWCMLKKPKKQ